MFKSAAAINKVGRIYRKKNNEHPFFIAFWYNVHCPRRHVYTSIHTQRASSDRITAKGNSNQRSVSTPRAAHTPTRSFPRTERRIGDAQRARSLAHPPHPALHGLLLRLDPQHQLIHRGVLLTLALPSLQRSQVHADAREVLDISMQRGVRRCGHQLEQAALGVLAVLVAHLEERVMEGVDPLDRVGREGHLEAAVGEIDRVGYLEEPLDGFEEERYELDREGVARRRGCGAGGNSVRSRGGRGTCDGRGGL